MALDLGELSATISLDSKEFAQSLADAAKRSVAAQQLIEKALGKIHLGLDAKSFEADLTGVAKAAATRAQEIESRLEVEARVDTGQAVQALDSAARTAEGAGERISRSLDVEAHVDTAQAEQSLEGTARAAEGAAERVERSFRDTAVQVDTGQVERALDEIPAAAEGAADRIERSFRGADVRIDTAAAERAFDSLPQAAEGAARELERSFSGLDIDAELSRLAAEASDAIERQLGLTDVDGAISDAVRRADASQDGARIGDEIRGGVESAARRTDISDAMRQATQDAQGAARQGGQGIGGELTGSITGGLDGLAGAISDVVERGVDQAQTSATAGGNRLGGFIKGGLVGIGVALGTMLVEGFQTAAEMAKQVALFESAGLTPEEAGAAGEIAGELWVAGWGESIADAGAAVMAVIAQTGMTGEEELREFARKFAAISAATGEDADRVARAAAQLVRNHLAGSYADAADLITAASQTAVNAGHDLLDTIEEYSPVFQQVGLDGKTALELMNTALLAGARNSDLAADAIKEYFLMIQGGSDDTKRAVESLGFNWVEMSGRIQSGGADGVKATQELWAALGKVESPAERSALAVGIFGTKAEDMASAVKGMDLSSITKAMDDFRGSTERAAKAQEDAIPKWKKAWDGFSSWFGDVASGIVNAVEGVGSAISSVFTDDLSEEVLGRANDSVRLVGETIREMGLSIPQATEAIAGMGKSASEMGVMLVDLGLSGSDLAQIINGIGLSSSDVSTVLVSMGVDVAKTAEILRAMGLDSETAGQVISGLGLSLGETALVIDSLGLSTEDTDRLIAQLGLTSHETEVLMAGLDAQTGSLGEATAGARAEFDLAAWSAAEMEGKLAGVRDTASEAETQIAYLNTILIELSGRNLTAEEALQRHNGALRDVRDALVGAAEAGGISKQALLNWDVATLTATESGDKLYTALSDLTGAHSESIRASLENALATGSTADALAAARATATASREEFIKLAGQYGLNRDEASLLADKIGILDGAKIDNKTFVTLMGERVLARSGKQGSDTPDDIVARLDAINKYQIDDKQFSVLQIDTIIQRRQQIDLNRSAGIGTSGGVGERGGALSSIGIRRDGGFAGTAPIRGFADGGRPSMVSGWINAPGGPRDDLGILVGPNGMPLGISPDEFVVQERIARGWGPFLEALNAGEFGARPGFAAGGAVDPVMLAAARRDLAQARRQYDRAVAERGRDSGEAQETLADIREKEARLRRIESGSPIDREGLISEGAGIHGESRAQYLARMRRFGDEAERMELGITPSSVASVRGVASTHSQGAMLAAARRDLEQARKQYEEAVRDAGPNSIEARETLDDIREKEERLRRIESGVTVDRWELAQHAIEGTGESLDQYIRRMIVFGDEAELMELGLYDIAKAHRERAGVIGMDSAAYERLDEQTRQAALAQLGMVGTLDEAQAAAAAAGMSVGDYALSVIASNDAAAIQRLGLAEVAASYEAGKAKLGDYSGTIQAAMAAMDGQAAALARSRLEGVGLADQFGRYNIPITDELTGRTKDLDAASIADKLFDTTNDDLQATTSMSDLKADEVPNKLFKTESDSEQAVADLSSLKLDDVPDKTFTVDANTAPAEAKLENLNARYNRLNELVFNYNGQTQERRVAQSGEMLMAATGGLVSRLRVRGFAEGGGLSDGTSGWVSGPGGPTDDRVLLMGPDGQIAVSPDEFIVRASQAKKHRGLLEALNAGAAGFADGGSVGGGSGSMSVATFYADLLQVGSTSGGGSTAGSKAERVASAIPVDDFSAGMGEARDALDRVTVSAEDQAAAQKRARQEQSELNAETAAAGKEALRAADKFELTEKYIARTGETMDEYLLRMVNQGSETELQDLGLTELAETYRAATKAIQDNAAAVAGASGSAGGVSGGQDLSKISGASSRSDLNLAGRQAGIAALKGHEDKYALTEKYLAKDPHGRTMDEYVLGMLESGSPSELADLGLTDVAREYRARRDKGFSRGGVVPGPDPGRGKDNRLGMLGGEPIDLRGVESIMVPEFTEWAGGEAGVHRLNRLAEAGQLSRVFGRRRGFARGGVPGGGGSKGAAGGGRSIDGGDFAALAEILAEVGDGSEDLLARFAELLSGSEDVWSGVGEAILGAQQGPIAEAYDGIWSGTAEAAARFLGLQSDTDTAWSGIGQRITDAQAGPIATAYGALNLGSDGVAAKWLEVKGLGDSRWSEIGAKITETQSGTIQPRYDDINIGSQGVADKWQALKDDGDSRWGEIGAKITDTQVNTIKPRYDDINTGTAGVGTKVGELRDTWDTKWGEIGSKVTSTQVDTLDPAFTKINEGQDGVKKAAEAAAEGVSLAWDGIKAGIAKPINFMLGDVWNTGVVGAWAKIREWIPGVEPELGTLDLIAGFAGGGLVPGRDPGRGKDNQLGILGKQLVPLRGREPIMVPEFGDAMGGSAGIERLNRLAEQGRLAEVFGPGYAAGGVVGEEWSGIPSLSSAFDGEAIEELPSDLVTFVKAFVKNPLATLTGLIGAPLGQLGTQGAKPWGKVGTKGSGHIVGGMISNLKDQFGLENDGMGGPPPLTGQLDLDGVLMVDGEIYAIPTGPRGEFLKALATKMGTVYQWGAAGPTVFDCSGFMSWGLAQAGHGVGRLTADGFHKQFPHVAAPGKPGDLATYSARYSKASGMAGHIGAILDVGKGLMMHTDGAGPARVSDYKSREGGPLSIVDVFGGAPYGMGEEIGELPALIHRVIYGDYSTAAGLGVLDPEDAGRIEPWASVRNIDTVHPTTPWGPVSMAPGRSEWVGPVPPGDPVNRWAPLNTTTLNMLGLWSPENAAAGMLQIRTESTGDPLSFNDWDTNFTKRGTPSKGLRQIIGTTFDANAVPGFDKNIWDPVSNLLSTASYGRNRFGTIGAAFRGVAYDDGGTLFPGLTMAVNASGAKEQILTGSEREAWVQQVKTQQVTAGYQQIDYDKLAKAMSAQPTPSYRFELDGTDITGRMRIIAENTVASHQRQLVRAQGRR